jgi:hypothetical protein
MAELINRLKSGESGPELDAAVWEVVSGAMKGPPPPITTDLNATLNFLRTGWPFLLFRLEMRPPGWVASVKTPAHNAFVFEERASSAPAALLSLLVFVELGRPAHTP